MVPYALSLLDLAAVGKTETIGESFAGRVALAQLAERTGYARVWYAEHHNIGSVASSATAVLLAHVAAHTSTIRLGSGGVMLPNHSPLVIAEHFGTLAELHPGRIDLGLGRAPGTDQRTWRAMRRDPAASERFPQDVLELQGSSPTRAPSPASRQYPGRARTCRSTSSDRRCSACSSPRRSRLPFGFASHFAPRSLHEAVRISRERFTPSTQLDRPYVMLSQADEVMTVHAAGNNASRLRSVELLAEAAGRAG